MITSHMKEISTSLGRQPDRTWQHQGIRFLLQFQPPFGTNNTVWAQAKCWSALAGGIYAHNTPYRRLSWLSLPRKKRTKIRGRSFAQAGREKSAQNLHSSATQGQKSSLPRVCVFVCVCLCVCVCVCVSLCWGNEKQSVCVHVCWGMKSKAQNVDSLIKDPCLHQEEDMAQGFWSPSVALR